MWTNGTILQEIATILDLLMSLIMGKTIITKGLIANGGGWGLQWSQLYFDCDFDYIIFVSMFL